MLRDLELQPVYDSAEHDLVQDLIVPLLAESREYWRGVGFFTSGWLKNACMGIVRLVSNGGIARIVTSPIMQKSDWEALQVADRAKRDSVLLALLREQILDLPRSLSEDTLNALAWMVADGVLEFKFAIARNFEAGADYHDKVGVFIDDNKDVVAIHGSFNDSLKGSLNGEAFSVFKSWGEGQRPYVDQHRSRLVKLWSSGNAQFEVLPLPDAIRQQIVHLRSAVRPWPCAGGKGTYSKTQPVPVRCETALVLRPYQKDALDNWRQRNFQGIFEMATGTGKTFTALAAASGRRADLGRVAVLILVPYLHLLEQWRQNCEKCGFLPILCSGEHGQWPTEVRSNVQDYRLGMLGSICILAVHQTAATRRFAKAVHEIPPESTLLIADEVHRLGAPRLRDALLSCASMRIGLSATPLRWYDPEGTQTVLDYFTGICFQYSLEDAIGQFLAPYRYLPIVTSLTPEEAGLYEDLSRRIGALTKQADGDDPDISNRLKRLLLQRAQLVSAAANKLPLFLEIIQKQMVECREGGGELRDVLVYCAPGKHREVLAAISALGLRCHEFIHTVSMDKRESVLRQFAEGDIQVLIAIHCLDEGVDIPTTRTAYFLSSTTNPREFIQRRGRILRKFQGKARASVYDFLVMPNMEYAYLRRDPDLNLLRREMPRFAEFAACAENEFEARAAIRRLLDRFQMLHLLDLKPWDIYHEVMEPVEIRDRSCIWPKHAS